MPYSWLTPPVFHILSVVLLVPEIVLQMRYLADILRHFLKFQSCRRWLQLEVLISAKVITRPANFSRGIMGIMDKRGHSGILEDAYVLQRIWWLLMRRLVEGWLIWNSINKADLWYSRRHKFIWTLGDNWRQWCFRLLTSLVLVGLITLRGALLGSLRVYTTFYIWRHMIGLIKSSDCCQLSSVFSKISNRDRIWQNFGNMLATFPAKLIVRLIVLLD